MDNRLKQQAAAEPQLCVVCRTFYANPQHPSLCSQCFKAQPQEQEGGVAGKEETPATADASQTPAPLATAQADHGACWHCGKRAGLRAFTCKCAFSFCQQHRMPEAHACSFDFRAEGRAQLARLNPRVERDRLERI